MTYSFQRISDMTLVDLMARLLGMLWWPRLVRVLALCEGEKRPGSGEDSGRVYIYCRGAHVFTVLNNVADTPEPNFIYHTGLILTFLNQNQAAHSCFKSSSRSLDLSAPRPCDSPVGRRVHRPGKPRFKRGIFYQFE